jgi:hypothetical protein
MIIAVWTHSSSDLPVLNQLSDLASYFEEVPINHGQILMTAYGISADPTAKDQIIDLLDDGSLATELWDCVSRLTRVIHLHGTILNAVGHSSHFASLSVVCLSKPTPAKRTPTKATFDDSSDEEADEYFEPGHCDQTERDDGGKLELKTLDAVTQYLGIKSEQDGVHNCMKEELAVELAKRQKLYLRSIPKFRSYPTWSRRACWRRPLATSVLANTLASCAITSASLLA